MICHGCQKDVDEQKEASGYCYSHNNYFCWDCAHNKGCEIPNERCGFAMIVTPQWTFSFRESKD